MNKNGNVVLWVLLAVVGAVLALGGGVGLKYVLTPKQPAQEVSAPPAPAPQVVVDETANWKVYRNEEIGIEFKYPPQWQELYVQRQSEEQDPGYTGTRISISRSDSDFSFLLVASTPNFDFQGSEEGAGPLNYLGETLKFGCLRYNLPIQCIEFEIQGRKANSLYITPWDFGEYITNKIYLVENAGHKFSGIAARQVIKGLKVVSVNNPDAFIVSHSEIDQKLANNQLSASDKEDIMIFNKILSTLKFI